MINHTDTTEFIMAIKKLSDKDKQKVLSLIQNIKNQKNGSSKNKI